MFNDLQEEMYTISEQIGNFQLRNKKLLKRTVWYWVKGKSIEITQPVEQRAEILEK